MDNNISCPDCNSYDVQKIDKDKTIVSEKNGCGRVLVGCLFFPVAFFMKKKTTVKTQTYTYYVCRSCGREFRNN